METIEGIYNYLQLNDEIATGGQPSEAQLAAVAAAGYEVVINLAPHDTERALPDEQRSVQALGMEYINIPVIWRSPRPARVRALPGQYARLGVYDAVSHPAPGLGMEGRLCRRGPGVDADRVVEGVYGGAVV